MPISKDDKCADCGKEVNPPRSICWDCEKPLCKGCGKGKELRCKNHYEKWVLRGSLLFEGYK